MDLSDCYGLAVIKPKRGIDGGYAEGALEIFFESLR